MAHATTVQDAGGAARRGIPDGSGPRTCVGPCGRLLHEVAFPFTRSGRCEWTKRRRWSDCRDCRARAWERRNPEVRRAYRRRRAEEERQARLAVAVIRSARCVARDCAEPVTGEPHARWCAGHAVRFERSAA